MNREQRYIKLGNGQYADGLHGDILSAEEVLERLQEEKTTSGDLIKSEMDIIKRENNIVERKDTHYLNWNNNKNNPTLFTKSYKVLGREVKKNMNNNERAFVFVIMDYIETETNRVLINEENPTNKVLSDLMDLSVPSISRVISSLKKKNIIQTLGRNQNREIYINPLIAFDGKDIKKDILDLFSIEY